MARQCLYATAVVCLLASNAAAQAALEKPVSSDVVFPGNRKNTFSRLERMLQVEPEREPEPREPAGVSCSPAALKPEIDCRMPQPAAATTKPANDAVADVVADAKPVVTCTGPDCLVAAMPGTLGAPTRVASSSISQAPQSKVVTYGPMTSDSFERLVQRKRAAVRAKMSAAGGIDGSLKSFLQEREDPFKQAAAKRVLRHTTDQAGIPLPHLAASSAEPRADFEMRFKPQTPAMAPEDDDTAAAAEEAAGHSRTPAPAGRAWGTSEAARREAQRQQGATAGGPARPPMTEEEAARLEMQKLANSAARDAQFARKRAVAEAQRSRQQQYQRQQLQRKLKQQQGAGSNMRGGASASSAASSSSSSPDYKVMPGVSLAGNAAAKREPAVPVEVHVMPGSSRPVGQSAASEQQQQQVEVPQDLLDDPAPKPVVEQQTAPTVAVAANVVSEPQPQQRRLSPAASGSRISSSSAAAPKSVSSFSSASPLRQQHAQQLASAWETLDYVCALALLLVAPVAMFMAAAILEDLFVSPPAARSAAAAAAGGLTTLSSKAAQPFPLHWIALTRSLWRRCRRAFAAARKQLTGHASDLPTSANEGSGPIARGVATAAAFIHVFVTQLRQQAATAVAAARASSGGASAYASPFDQQQRRVSFAGSEGGMGVGAAAAFSSCSPFAVASLQQQGACVVQTPDTATATAVAELSVRRRH